MQHCFAIDPQPQQNNCWLHLIHWKTSLKFPFV